MKKFAIYNNKGGVGKTTSAINIAYSLHRMEKKVLVVDCDKTQKNCYMFFLTETVSKILPTKYENIRNTTYDTFVNLTEKDYNEFDYVIFDMPPVLDDYVMAILKGADMVFVPIKLGQFEVDGLINLLSSDIDNLGGIFVTMYRKDTQQKDWNDLKTALGDRVTDTCIHFSDTVEKSQHDLLPVGEYLAMKKVPRVQMFWRASNEYDELTVEIMRRLG